MHVFVITLIAILVLIFIGQKAFFSEPFETTKSEYDSKSDESLKLYVFVSGHCPHCHTYINNHHNNVINICKSKGIEVEKVQSDGSAKSNDLFNKYDVQFIPAGILVKGNKLYKKLGSDLSPQAVKNAIEN